MFFISSIFLFSFQHSKKIFPTENCFFLSETASNSKVMIAKFASFWFPKLRLKINFFSIKLNFQGLSQT